MPENTVFKKVEYALEALFESVKKLYSNNFSLIDKDVHEQTISHRIACDIELAMVSNKSLENLITDCEYNKHGANQKQYGIYIGNLCDRENKILNNKIKRIENSLEKKNIKITQQNIEKEFCNEYFRPDIILHERGNDNFNILAIEIKKNYRDITFDKIKLKVLTGEQYNYKIGLSLALKNNREYKPTFTFFVQEDYYEIYKSKIKDSCEPEQIDTFVVVNDQGNIKYLDKEEYEKYSQKMLNYNTKQNNISIGTNNNTQE